MMIAVLLREPHGIVARVMTWLPFSAGPLIMFRASTDLDFLAWWEVVGAFVGPAALDLDCDPRRRAPLPHRPLELVAAEAVARSCARHGCRNDSRQSSCRQVVEVTVVSPVGSPSRGSRPVGSSSRQSRHRRLNDRCSQQFLSRPLRQPSAAPPVRRHLPRRASGPITGETGTRPTPGCAVGVSVNGHSVLEKGLRDGGPRARCPESQPDTIFEAGSVSKQFTAAAVLLLARDGKLSLDDPVRKYVPELPDYGAPLTIRHMLNHTSGLRDWGSVAAIAGWPRTTRVHTHAHVLDIVSRQRSLNFPSGTRYSYSNTGYNLAAIIVSRVSGESFAEFSRERLFEPLGMARTSWRDDYTRIVKDRAIAYSDGSGGFSQPRCRSRTSTATAAC